MEIERKFLVEAFPPIEPVTVDTIYQAYLSVDPEIRLRHNVNTDLHTTSIKKTLTELCREEVEVAIDDELWYTLYGTIKGTPIMKYHKVYKVEGVIVDVSLVDPGLSTSFMYAEVEFASEEEANAYIPLPWFGKEVTYDPSYKMKEYWRRTRP